MSESKGEGLVDELRRLPVVPGSWVATAVTRAADALEAQARELVEAQSQRENYWNEMVRLKSALTAAKGDARVLKTDFIDTYQPRIAALEDAVRVKDEALRPFSRVAEAYDGEEHIRRMPALLHYLVDLTIEHFRRARTALSNGEPHDR